MTKIKVNILTENPQKEVFLRQLDKNRFKDTFDFSENSTEDIIWDVVVVYEGLQQPILQKYRKGGLIFISGEPPWSRVYSPSFLNQFDHLITAHSHLKHRKNHLQQPALNWHFGYDYYKQSFNYTFEDLQQIPIPKKTKNISIISSNQAIMPGHRNRLQFIEKLKSDFGSQIDFYGKGINPIADKANAILPYRFHICIENSSIDNYWSEKIADPFLGYSIPIYFGCKNISSYFDGNSYFNLQLNDWTKSKSLIEAILSEPEKIYSDHLPLLLAARQTLLDQYNFFPMIELFIKTEITKNTIIKESILIPTYSFSDYKFRVGLLRFKRLAYKLYDKTFK